MIPEPKGVCPMTKLYEVQLTAYDVRRPYAVVATSRSFNRIVALYETEAIAKRWARALEFERSVQS
jgi:hypothetical protein